MTEAENEMVSVERVISYSKLPQEALAHNPHVRLAPSWLHDGQIKFQNAKLRYREGLDLVLRVIDPF